MIDQQCKQVESASIKCNYFFFSTDSLNKIGSTSSPQTNPVSSVKAIPYSELMAM